MAQLRKSTGSSEVPFDPTYLVVFVASPPYGPYEPLMPLTPDSAARGSRPHGLDRDVAAALEALWYALYLPRSLLDTVDRPISVLCEGRQFDNPQDVRLLPSWALNRPDLITNLRDEITLILTADSTLAEAAAFGRAVRAPLPVAVFSSLNQQSLERHWSDIAALYSTSRPRLTRPPPLRRRGPAAARLLPYDSLARQVPSPLPIDSEDARSTVRAALIAHAYLAAVAEMEDQGCPPAEFHERIRPELKRQIPLVHLDVSVACPGVATTFRRATRRKGEPLTAQDHEIESAAIQWLVTHRALASDGSGYILGTVGEDVFSLLDRLETHCRGRVSAKTIWRLLRQLGSRLSALLDDEALLLVGHAASVTVFGDVPFGLAILPGLSDPLVCRAPVTYRPLTPLTRAVQLEGPRQPFRYLKTQLKVVVLECLDDDDPIRPLSEGGWKLIREIVVALPNSQFTVVHAGDVPSLVSAVKGHPCDILIVSAHGYYDKGANHAGLVVGGQRFLGLELTDLPPLVILSACHVSPRGIGAVTIADLMLARGATAVLGTLIPVDVRRNSLLMVRLFIYIEEAMRGKSSLRTIDRIWHHTVVTNAVNEVLSMSQQVKEWAHHGGPTNNVLRDFMLSRSVGRLQLGNVYAQTEAILQEMATERGFGATFQATLRGQSYFPESMFYVLLGRPDRIVVHDPIVDRMNAATMKS